MKQYREWALGVLEAMGTVLVFVLIVTFAAGVIMNQICMAQPLPCRPGERGSFDPVKLDCVCVEKAK